MGTKEEENMTTKMLESKLLESLESKLDGYKARKKDLTLISRGKEFHKLLQLIVLIRGGYWEINGHAYLIHQDLENHYRVAIDANFETVTIGSSFKEIFAFLGSELNKASFSYSIATESDIERIANIIVEQFNRIENEYFEKFSNIEDISNALNTSPEERCVHMTANPIRCAKGVLASSLAKEARLDSLINIYRKRVEVAVPKYQGQFESCVEYALHKL